MSAPIARYASRSATDSANKYPVSMVYTGTSGCCSRARWISAQPSAPKAELSPMRSPSSRLPKRS
jgi:hypothetical protein